MMTNGTHFGMWYDVNNACVESLGLSYTFFALSFALKFHFLKTSQKVALSPKKPCEFKNGVSTMLSELFCGVLSLWLSFVRLPLLLHLGGDSTAATHRWLQLRYTSVGPKHPSASSAHCATPTFCPLPTNNSHSPRGQTRLPVLLT